MNGGAKAGILLTGLALAGCAATAGKLEIKPIADAGEKFRHGNVDVAAARGQLALGNVGLALETGQRLVIGPCCSEFCECAPAERVPYVGACCTSPARG